MRVLGNITLSVQAKLLILVIVPVLAFIILAASSLIIMAQVNEGITRIYEQRIVPMKELKAMADAYAVKIVNTAHKARNGTIDWEMAVKNIDEANKIIDEKWMQYYDDSSADEMMLEEEKKLAETAVSLIAKAKISIKDLRKIMTEMDVYALGDYIDRELYPNIEPISETFSSLLEVHLAHAKEERDHADILYTRSQRWFLIGALVVIAFVILAGFFTIRSICGPLNKLRKTMKDIERESDLTQQVTIDSNDEIGVMAQAFNSMLTKFNVLISEITGVAVHMGSAAEEMSNISNQTSQSANSQQAQTTQVATATNEMSASIQEVVNSARDASNAALDADRQAVEGNTIVGETVVAINDLAREIQTTAEVINQLDKDSESIGGVLDVIRGIAEQTNLLALNAAIEAARAGEQGRGFAVVADEVRTLAQRSQQATEEIQSMIERLQKGAKNAVEAMELGRDRVQSGVELAGTAGTALQSITKAVATISEKNTQIASASEQQCAVAEEINKNIADINNMAQETVEVSIQTSNSSDSLASLASDLQNKVSQFKI